MSRSVGKGAPARTSAAPDAHRPGCGRGGRGWLWRACFRLGDPASLREEPEGGSPAQAAGPEAAVTPEAGSPGDAQAADTGREPTRVPAAGSSPGRGPGLEGGRPPRRSRRPGPQGALVEGGARGVGRALCPDRGTFQKRRHGFTSPSGRGAGFPPVVYHHGSAVAEKPPDSLVVRHPDSPGGDVRLPCAER